MNKLWKTGWNMLRAGLLAVYFTAETQRARRVARGYCPLIIFNC